ncbi:MAG TPA: flagellar biosynthesis protein FliQ [Alphaproteobacteria bacterium]|nr:flagellar biosynthesis protein FliQ [Alphaproteobacteria bacterium]HCS22503.1 flagellar biosynthetic protein FliQ [Rhodospirillaceae bacterium]HRI75991.1 flagellar biosynthesis protein FliQ [Alphaproteobacteria bacterium]HRJ67107.1 flagellar biosynthesis protein FliQ [Alphaproteobacteria bacterium]
MNEAEIIDITREAILLTIRIAGPVMLIGLVTGLIIALIQALTQIQEMTLAFVPKIITIFLAIFLLLPMMAQALIAFTEKIADKIVGIS